MSVPITTHTPTQFFGPMTMADLVPDVDTDLLSAQCTIVLDISTARCIAANVIPALGAGGGILASDSDPSYQRVNGAGGDDCIRLTWAATSVIEIQFPPTPLPPDLDPAENLVVHFMVSRDGTTDDCKAAVLAYETSVGAYAADAEMGGEWAALDGAAEEIQERTVTLDADDIAGHPSVITIAVVPAAHGTDTLCLYGGWFEYTRMLRAS